MSKPAPTYTVVLTYCVDCPELRCSSMWKPRRGYRFVERWVMSHRGAVNTYKEALEGYWDYGSEYVAAVEVLASRGSGSPRWARKRVDRDTEEFRARRFSERLETLELLAWQRDGDPPPVAGEIWVAA